MKRYAGAVILALALAACGGSPPQPQPAQEERYGAPLANDPRDVRSFAADPCRSPLSSGEMQELGFNGTGRLDVLLTGERGCVWDSQDDSQDVTFIVVGTRDVLVDTYRTRQFAIFRPTTIAGLPATLEQSSTDSIGCTITVGTAAGQGFIADYYEGDLGANGQADDPCGRGQRVAERFAASLPPLPAK
ncbi:DUF3558 domain-containing protein [Actinomycetospora callitridis]|uniref:DUF3558 domain-containing protein n=1 Tax=Actinomycetospora callitridis TaxID=913944 RepID=UPI003082633F